MVSHFSVLVSSYCDKAHRFFTTGALLFFDECESLFRSRSKGGSLINPILTELERALKEW